MYNRGECNHGTACTTEEQTPAGGWTCGSTGAASNIVLITAQLHLELSLSFAIDPYNAQTPVPNI